MKTSLFAGFNSAVRSMQHSQFALTVHSSNIAHANDPNYTRRDVLPASETRLNGPGVSRVRDAFVESQYQVAASMQGKAGVRQDIMSKIEDIFGDPVDGGLRRAIDQLFDSFQGLAENPSDSVARWQVISAASTFAQEIESTYKQLTAVAQTVNEQLATRVNEVNSNLDQVFELNKRIAELQRKNMDSAELEDQRALAVDKLSKLTGATSLANPDGSVRVIVGNQPVVDGPTVIKLTLAEAENGPMPAWRGIGTYHGGGTLAGLISVRDTEVAQLQTEVDRIGRTVATKINEQQQQGFNLSGSTPPPNIFEPDGAKGFLKVNRNLKAHDIAASSTAEGLPGNGDNARKLAELGITGMLTSEIIPGQEQAPAVYYRNLVGWIGTVANHANQTNDIAESHIQVAEQQRQSQWGVSLDEESARLTMEQKAFSACARVINVMDQMLDDLINRTGR